MSDNPVLSRMGIARRADFLAAGTEKVTAAIKSGKAQLIIIASDISPKTEKELRFLANGKAEVMRIGADMLTMSAAIGIKAGVAAVTDSGLAQTIRKAGMLNDQI